MSTPVAWQIFGGLLLFTIVFVPLERLFPFQPRQNVFRRGWSVDVLYYVIGCGVGRFSDATGIWAIPLFRSLTGFHPLHAVAAQPFWLQFVEVLFLSDFLNYWFHRGMHAFSWGWKLHQIHHTTEQMDWLANTRLHPIDKLLGDFFQFIPIFLIGFSSGPLLAYTIVLGFQGFIDHSNIRINYGPLKWILVSPGFHHWHHCNEPEHYNKNFSMHLVLFDLMFGTCYMPPNEMRPTTYGIPDPLPEEFWGQLIAPFRPARPTIVGPHEAEVRTVVEVS